jgi:hypothetical protein
MSTIAIGDIHGNVAAVADLLRQLRSMVTSSDVVVFLGDYIDRGADSKGCIDAILEFEHEVDASVVCPLEKQTAADLVWGHAEFPGKIRRRPAGRLWS